MSFNRSDAKLLGKGLAGLTILGTTVGGYSRVSAMTLGATVPVVFGSMLGILLLSPATNYLSSQIYRSNVVRPEYYHFALHAASWTLGSLIGLAVTSVFISMAANPFTLPALIAGGVSAAVMLALYAMTRGQQPRNKTEYARYARYENFDNASYERESSSIARAVGGRIGDSMRFHSGVGTGEGAAAGLSELQSRKLGSPGNSF